MPLNNAFTNKNSHAFFVAVFRAARDVLLQEQIHSHFTFIW